MSRHYDPSLVEEAISSVLLESKIHGLKDKLNEAAGAIKVQAQMLNEKDARIACLERVPRLVRWLFRAV